MTERQEKTKKSPGERIFAVDRRVWSAVCDLGMIEALTYLVIASGTGGDQRTSGWSATAVETYAGIHNSRGRPALRRLQVNGFLSTVENGKLRRHTLHSAEEIPAVKAAAVTVSRDTGFNVNLTTPQWIWLPNSLVEGAAGEITPVRLLQDAQEPDALRLFIDLYYFHDLAANCGVEWRSGSGIRRIHAREEVGQHGAYKVWAFTASDMQTFHTAPFYIEGEFWNIWDLLRDMGLVEFITHLVSSDTEMGEVLCPLPWRAAAGENAERAISIAADAAGKRMAPFYDNPNAMLVPVLKTKPNVQLIGIARMKYRPHTARTAEWLSQSDEWQKIATSFQEMATKAACGIKEASR